MTIVRVGRRQAQIGRCSARHRLLPCARVVIEQTEVVHTPPPSTKASSPRYLGHPHPRNNQVAVSGFPDIPRTMLRAVESGPIRSEHLHLGNARLVIEKHRCVP
jgi:hypothetical protein